MTRVVPVAVEVVALDLQLAQFLRRDLLAGRIAATIESGAHDEATAVGRVADEVDDGLVGPQRASAPVDRDEREQAVLDLVPLAGAGREVADVDRHVRACRRGVAVGASTRATDSCCCRRRRR